ncbi:GH-E family nuclease [Marinigracilibium pacificum]|uniref:Toxin YqcG C-terminal domain-containing protein n=1 Tax=Marinigracilibium pacificum TaxID=2729599 RepID=A0A848J009_9BACT|nr:GH-E family nuclease [Marinigracilibium pacificum]NMM49186.1 hypothetical protein [Marinigracilibium pacificum]
MFEKEIAYVEPLSAVNNLKGRDGGNVSLESLSQAERDALFNLLEDTVGLDSRDVASLSTDEIIDLLEPSVRDVSKGSALKKSTEIIKKVGRRKPKFQFPSAEAAIPSTNKKKNPLNQSKEKLQKMQQITEIRKRKDLILKPVKKYFNGLKKNEIASVKGFREKNKVRKQFEEFEKQLVSKKIEIGTSDFKNELIKAFPNINWQQPLVDLSSLENELNILKGIGGTLSEESKTEDNENLSSEENGNQKDETSKDNAKKSEQSQNEEKIGKNSEGENKKEDGVNDKSDSENKPFSKVVDLPVSQGKGVIKSPLELVKNPEIIGKTLSDELTEENKKAKESLPEINTPSGLESGVLKLPEVKPDNDSDAKIEVPNPSEEPAKEEIKSKVEKTKSKAVEKLPEDIGEFPVSLPDIDVDLGPKPEIPLKGKADPENAKKLKEETSNEVESRKERFKKFLEANRGIDLIKPKPDNEILKAKEELSDEVEELNTSLKDKVNDSIPEIEQGFAIEAEKSIGQKLQEEQNKLDSGKEELNSKKEAARKELDTNIQEKSAETAKEQEAAKIKAQSETEAKKQEWQKENEAVYKQYEVDAAKADKATSEQIQNKLAETDKAVTAKLSEAQSETDTAIAEADKKVQSTKEEVEQDKSWWDKAADAISSVFDSLKSAINSIFDGLIKLVESIIEAAKAAVNGLIDAATKAITGFIKAFGDILKGIVSVVFAAFPSIAKKFNDLIDKAVDFAVKAVEKAAEVLKKAVNMLLDAFAAAVKFYIEAYRALVNAVLSVVEGLVVGLIKIFKGITNLGKAAIMSPDHFMGQMSVELLGQDVTQRLPNEREFVENAEGAAVDAAVAQANMLREDKQILSKSSYEESDVMADEVLTDMIFDNELMAQIGMIPEGGTVEFGESDDKEHGMDAVKKDAVDVSSVAETSATESAAPQTVQSPASAAPQSEEKVGPFNSPMERASYLAGTMKDAVVKWFSENKTKIILSLIGAIGGLILANILTGGAVMAAIPLILQIVGAYFAVEGIYQMAKHFGSYIGQAWPGNLVQGATHLARGLAALTIELVFALLFGGKAALKGAKKAIKTVSKKGVKGAMKSGAKAAKASAKKSVKETGEAFTKLGATVKDGGKALVKNGKVAMKGVRKGMVKGAKTFDDLGKRLSKNLRFKKFRISVEKRRFKLEGEVNPWVLLASGKVEYIDASDPRVKGKSVGSKVKLDKNSKANWDKDKDGVLIGWQDTKVSKGKGIDDSQLTGSKYVQDLDADEAKAIDEFAELTNSGMTNELRGNRIRGGAKSERVSLRKEVRDEVYKNADSGMKDANGYTIYLDQKTFKPIPNYGTHYPKKTPLGHPHPKAGQPVPANLVGKPRADIGHAKGQTWEKRLAKHKRDGLSREEIIEIENNSALYVLEERSSNRSRKLD